MKLLSRRQPPVYNLLSIGQRGVGKTVFLAGSYAELHASQQQNQPQSLWFECQTVQDKENLDSILNYVARTGEYPPATMKITDFHFSLKQRSLWGVGTLCYFRWWDIPGENCNFDHPDFQKMVLDSHSCCVFINAARLLNDPSYLGTLEEIVKQVSAIATLVDREAIDYAFAIIFTQCDRLTSSPISRLQIEQNIQRLITALEAAEAKYQRFYTAIPIEQGYGSYRLNSTGAAASLLWLVSQLQKTHKSPHRQTLATSLRQGSRSTPRLGVLARPGRSILVLAIASLSLAGIAIALLTAFDRFSSNELVLSQSSDDPKIKQYQALLRINPDDFDTLVALTTRYLELGQLQKAIPVMEKIVQLQPKNLDWRVNLAKLYELTEQGPKAETVYDQILVQDKSNFKALLGKAMIRRGQGDFETAKRLFQQAEAVAPSSDLKDKIRTINQE